MLHKRKRDWPVIVFRCRAYLRGLPASIREHALRRQALWNDLVAIREPTVEAARIIHEMPAGAWRDALRKALWEEFDVRCRAATEASGLDWEAGPDVFEHFLSAHRRALRCGGHLHPQRRLDQVRVVHRYTSGGLPLDRVFSTRARRFRAERPPAAAYADEIQTTRRRRVVDATYGVDAASVPFRLRFHRPLPPKGYLKQVILSGRFRHWEPGWEWHVCLLLEVPPDTPNADPGLSAGFDLGWRHCGDYLRVGVVCDTAGRSVEIRLPLNMGTGQTRKHQQPGSWPEVFALDKRIDAGVQDAKARVREHLAGEDLPEEWRLSLRALHAWKSGSLVRLLRYLAEHADTPPQRECLDVLERWRRENDRLRHVRNDAAERMVARRRWLYRNVAAWLAREYEAVAWEGDLSLKDMAEDDDQDAALKAAQRYRQIVCLHELRLYVRQAIAKADRLLCDREAAMTTRTCWLCGAAIEPGAARVLRCANGHECDQDQNAARNLLSQMLAESGVKPDLRDWAGVGWEEGFAPPPQLRDVLVPLAPEKAAFASAPRPDERGVATGGGEEGHEETRGA